LGTLNNVVRFAVRNNWIAECPSEKLERHERPRPERHPQRALGREEIARLLANCLPAYRDLVAVAIYTGMRLSELLGLTWDDVDFDRCLIHVRAQLSRSHFAGRFHAWAFALNLPVIAAGTSLRLLRRPRP
jgi:integrase